MKKTHKVVMLPTEKASKLYFFKDILEYDPFCIRTAIGDIIKQHLYIISDENAKEGGLAFDSEEKVGFSPIIKVLGNTNFVKENPNRFKKIVATTDDSIGYTDHKISPVPNFCDYPKIPESFIQSYIKSYNEGKPITEVDLEMDEIEKPDR